MTQSFQWSGGAAAELLESGLQSLAGIAEAAEAISAEASAGTRRAVAAGRAVFERLAAAKSFAEAVAIQADGARDGYEALVSGAARMSRLYAELGRQACMPFEDRVAKRV